MALSPRARRRTLVGVLGCTVLIAGLDAAAPGVTAPLRAAAGDVFGPVERSLTARDNTVAKLTDERDAARREVAKLQTQQADSAQLQALLASLPAAKTAAVPAQIVGYASTAGPSHIARVTIDVGAADGIRLDESVVSGTGLMGRTVRVDRWTSDVQLITDPAAVVGVRVGASGALGTLSSTTPAGVTARSGNDLTVTMIGDADVAVGDQVQTLGSVGNSPYLPSLVVGKVVSVDPDRGQAGRTAVVRPAVDPGSTKFVAVLSTSARVSPRPAASGG